MFNKKHYLLCVYNYMKLLCSLKRRFSFYHAIWTKSIWRVREEYGGKVVQYIVDYWNTGSPGFEGLSSYQFAFEILFF